MTDTPKANIPKELEKDMAASKNLQIIIGAYGDMENCVGIVENVDRPKEGGIFTKLYGCSYLFKGYPDAKILDLIGLPKAMISVFPRRLVYDSIVAKVVFAFMFIFAKRRLVRYLHIYFYVIDRTAVKKCNFDPNWYCKSVKEIRRALEVALSEVRNEGAASINPENKDIRIWKGEIWEVINVVKDLVSVFIEYDSAYKLRVQDVLPEMNKKKLREDPIKELRRLRAIMVRREKSVGLRRKFMEISRLLLVLLKVSKGAREFMVRFLCEIDLNKVKLDEADRYFCLRREGYDFWDAPIKDRLEERERIDKEKNHNIPIAMLQSITPEQLAQMEKDGQAKKA